LKKVTNYGTWNVKGIRGKMEEITSELGKLKMDAIGVTEKKEGHRFGNSRGLFSSVERSV